MALFLVVLGGAAVVEVHRAISSVGGAKDVQELRHREETLRRQLQDIQKELEKSQAQRRLTEDEAAQLAAINHQLHQDKDLLSREASSLKAENEELAARADRLLERQALLESCAESLKLENGLLIQQFDRLKAKHDQEGAAFQERLEELKAGVAASLQRFTEGGITADQLIAFLSGMGVELRCPREEVAKLPQRLAIAGTQEERTQALHHVELKVGDNWLERMKLASESPHRAARLLMGGAASAAAARALPAPPAPAPAAEQRRLTTPRALETVGGRVVVVPALKLTSHAVADAESEDKIAAVHAPAAAAPLLAAEPQAEPQAAPKAAAKSRSLLFRPAKAVKRAVGSLKSQQALLEVDMPLEAGASAVPRMPFDTAREELGGMKGGDLMAM